MYGGSGYFILNGGSVMNDKPLFSLGQLVITRGALELFENSTEKVVQFLVRHVTGDYGLVCPEDKGENEKAVANGFRILSVYEVLPDKRIWIITEADRSSTTILLPEEY
jgi:hypothetical protein